MLLALSQRPKSIAWFYVMILYVELAIPLVSKAESQDISHFIPMNKRGLVKLLPNLDTSSSSSSTNIVYDKKPLSIKLQDNLQGGPGQPEMQSFSSVNNTNMVDLFSGDFSYNIPLLDVGGYPVNLSYRSGITMDQEASWCGLGFSINPGSINRNLRGIPDDFNGTDSVKKISSIRENKTVGVTAGADVELTGLPLNVGASLGVFHNNYRGWGLENGLNASINCGVGSQGSLTGGLSVTNNSQEGLTIAPSISVNFNQQDAEGNAGIISSFTTSLPYNSRYGLKGLQLSTGITQFKKDNGNQYYSGSSFSSFISFSSPSYTPSITMPFTSRQFSFTAKIGTEHIVAHSSAYITGYVSKQKIEDEDTLMALPAYGYLHYQQGAQNISSLLDFNREKELTYREKPAVPNIAVPIYTYDVFSITGEGTGGMFRPYRSDIGFIHDHYIRTKDKSDRLSVDFGAGDFIHAGADLNINRAYTQNGPWLDNNSIKNVIAFKNDSANFEAAYFKNPAEKALSSNNFYNATGGDDVVTVDLFQASPNSSSIQATNYLTRYKNKQVVGKILLKPADAIRKERDKRSQVISYLNAKEAAVVGLSKYIENYTLNQFNFGDCSNDLSDDIEDDGTGLIAEYFTNRNFLGTRYPRTDTVINNDWGKGAPTPTVAADFPKNNFSVRWSGRLKAPVTGTYIIKTTSDDGVRLWLNDSVLINQWNDGPATSYTCSVNLIAGEMYKIKLEYYENGNKAVIKLLWTPPAQSEQIIHKVYLYPPPAKDTFQVSSYLSKEKRQNAFRKDNHISEITVLNNDGRRYVYGLPIYNLQQHEATFAINNTRGNKNTGLAGFTPGVDNSTHNKNGKDWYYNREEMPAYAHSFLLTGIVSPDYVDVTGNGISDDDLGDAVKFNYSKIRGFFNPYKWRAPYIKDSVMLNEGLKTDTRDDKGNYVYGEKELWYLHSIISKTMIATFTLENRIDLVEMDELGNKYYDSSAKRLKEINLYNKADFIKKGMSARPIKTVHFEYNYELCKGINKPINDSGKLTLKKIWFTYNGNNKGKQNPYIFNYNTKNPSYSTRYYDRWGNYKDPMQNPGSITGNIIDNAEYPYTLQDSTAAAQNAAAWSLDSIYLPSGGSIKVDFESDDYAFVQNKRAMQLFKLAGLGADTILHSTAENKLYTSGAENLYVYVNVPSAVSNKKDIYYKYLADIKKLYFKLFVKMPSDQYGSGYEYVSCYADLDEGNSYGRIDAHTIWLKISGISLKGDEGGSYSPLAKAGIQFLRLNLPSKAYPASEVGDNIDLDKAVRMIASLADNIKNAFTSFDKTARNNNWCNEVDLNRTYVRLNNPDYKKYGGGHRVKRIKIYDNWDKMTGQRAAIYGQEYTYTTTEQVNGIATTISSGVASYEPGIGGEENPFRVPIEYVEKVAPLGPVSLAYSEEPLGESFFPSPGVGYSKVRVRTINYKNKRSANGFDETGFYTARDFPVFTDRSLLDPDTKKRFKPALANFLRINARHYLSLSQGFKVELNDMHGKLRSQASYAETDLSSPIKYTENVYKMENSQVDYKRLANEVTIMRPDGTIDTTAVIGKDVELMVDMREQQSITNGYNVSINADMFFTGLPPIFVIPSLLNLAQREENLYRSAAIVKVINRYGILDSVIQIDKGSKISTKDMMYDSETGDVLLTRTQNEFNDPVYNFNYPAHWAYNEIGLAYKNIDLQLNHINIRNGKINTSLPVADSLYFSGGDEVLVAGKQKTSNATTCTLPYSTFPVYAKLWVIDTSLIKGGPRQFYFVDENGSPYTGYDLSLKIVRSGRRNILSSVGSITTLQNPLHKDPSTQLYSLVLNDSSKVIAAGVNEFKQFWKVEDRKGKRVAINCVTDSAGLCNDTIPATYQDTTVTVCFTPTRHFAYGLEGTYIYSNLSDDYGVLIPDTTGFWASLSDANKGRLNQSALWVCGGCAGSQCGPSFIWVGYSKAIYIPSSDTLFIGLAGDNQVRIKIDDSITLSRTFNDGLGGSFPFIRWHIFPVYLTKGYHNFTIQGWNAGDQAGFGAELYNMTRAELISADSNTVKSHTIYSTIQADSQSFTKGYSCPVDYTLDSTGGTHKCIKYIACPDNCDTVISSECYSNITDTVMNPYQAGILGNWRSNKNYVYYASRAETDPAATTNIRTDGAFKSFSAFWSFQNGTLIPQYDTIRWVWNNEQTLFNKKGLEIENKDPLGRYNAGLYGYLETMPTAVIQNAHYRESAFEGFEDYDFTTHVCDTACSGGRHIDFTAYKNKLDSTQKHTGKRSLKLSASESAAISCSLVTDSQDSAQASMTYSPLTDSCAIGGNALKDIKIPNTILLPAFSPFRGRHMLISAWVKEGQPCSSVTYENNRISVFFTGNSTVYHFTASGNIIEGWQRYEAIFDIPADATNMTVNLEATGSADVYFDDLRIHPFNANMKSFIYNPIDLRLMAELDENNYASFYEYDDDGTLIRVKKETQRGIKTIKETRSALIKE